MLVYVTEQARADRHEVRRQGAGVVQVGADGDAPDAAPKGP